MQSYLLFQVVELNYYSSTVYHNSENPLSANDPTHPDVAALSVQERLNTYLIRQPRTSEAAFVAASANIMGAVELGTDSSVWYQCVLRGDINTITIGRGSNIQDGSIIHLADDYSCAVGEYTTVGHRAMIHACQVGDECLVGMSATILDGVVIGNRCIIGAGSLITKHTEIPEGSLVMGSPAKVVRTLNLQEQRDLRKWAQKYIEVARAHAHGQIYSH
jgi:carbonic anhydrase/acetyltransferase-like protein (isoleucine patch superfamily)